MTELLQKAREYQDTYEIVGRAHYLASDGCAALNRGFGIPVIIITAVVGTTIFSTFSDNDPSPVARIVTGLVSLAGTVLAALQTGLGFEQTAQKHKAAGEGYRAVRRRFELFELKYLHADMAQYDKAMAEFTALVEELAQLPKEYPTIPDKYYNRAKREWADRSRSAVPIPNPSTVTAAP